MVPGPNLNRPNDRHFLLASTLIDYVTGNRLENGTCSFKLPGVSQNTDSLVGWEISCEPVDVT